MKDKNINKTSSETSKISRSESQIITRVCDSCKNNFKINSDNICPHCGVRNRWQYLLKLF